MKDLPVTEARARMLALVAVLEGEPVSLDDAPGRVLAEPVMALRDQPPFDSSAMDGWAVRGPGETFDIIGESAAGHAFAGVLADGQAVRIFTGAPVPPGAERVVIQEVATRDGAVVRGAASPAGPRHIRGRARDFAAGAALLPPGVRLDPWRLALAAAAGRAELNVAKRPRVIILSTGEEIVPAGSSPGPDQIFDAGGPALAALIARWGGEAVRLAATGDSVEAIVAAASGCGGDLIVTVGGASVGDHDLVKPALARLGLVLAVETVRLRPGKPTWFGVLSDGRRVLGLPGNPASALVCAELFLRPVLTAMQGADPAIALASARLATPLAANGGREHWARARLTWADGGLIATAMTDQDSSLVSIFAQADGLIRQPVNAPAMATGDIVDVLLLQRL